MNVREQIAEEIWDNPIYQRWERDYTMECCWCGMIWRVSNVDEVLNMDAMAHKFEITCDDHVRVSLDKNAPLGVLLRVRTALKHAPKGR